MNQNIGTELIQFIKESPSAFHAVATMKKEFLNHGFTACASWQATATLLPLKSRKIQRWK